ncbi:hypothetical protein [Desulfopila aestuarii]|uniref:Uncharacterized protein n=1 Tax=Desulfopila aestuarii DSM 18488 TaxID=1121416 RepID=A0A1M7XYQ4_9BACT|nr:hypothetical protein [Desulfopila aestuarii]SHO44205.1 hypothetical protein SAMN02745220_00700 [Desulfopila aestuarii DSM 18488]
MNKGDTVIAEHPDSRTKKRVRSYGIVQDITKRGNVIIEMADGSLIKRKFHTIAVFIQPPSNWQELYEQQHVSFVYGKKTMMPKRSSTA